MKGCTYLCNIPVSIYIASLAKCFKLYVRDIKVSLDCNRPYEVYEILWCIKGFVFQDEGAMEE